jgi:hypothetical protein
MHMTGKEKTLAIKPVHEVLAAGVAVAEAESDVVGTGIFTTSNCKSVAVNLLHCWFCGTALK